MDFRITNRSSRLITAGLLIIIIAFGCLLRFQALIYTGDSYIPHGDAAKYLLYAYNVRNFGQYSQSSLRLYPPDTSPDVIRDKVRPDALVTPGYPLFLSLFLGGKYSKIQFDNIKLAQVLLSCFTILLAYYLFLQLGRLYGLIAASLTALSPHLVNMNLFLLTETLFCFFLLGFLFLLSRIRPESSSLLFLATGALLGLATLTRPWVQGFAILLAGYMLLSRQKMAIRKPIIMLLGFMIVIAPWITWNQLTFGTPGNPTLTVKSIHHGMYPDMMYNMQPETKGYPYKADPKAADFAHSPDTILEELKLRYSESPLLYLKWYLAGKISTVFSWGLLAGASDVFVYVVESTPYSSLPQFYVSRYYMEKFHPVVVLLSLIGVVLVWLPARMLGLSQRSLFFARAISLLIMYFIILHIIGAPFPRYSIPLRPVMYGMMLFPVLLTVRIIKYMLWNNGRPGKQKASENI